VVPEESYHRREERPERRAALRHAPLPGIINGVKPKLRRIILVFAAAVLVALLLILVRGVYVVQALELKTLDARFRALRPSSPADTSIVIVDVDELSLDLLRPSVGRWPWPRDVWAMLVRYAAAGGARAIAFDFSFPDPDRADPAADSAFVDASTQAGITVQALGFQRQLDTAQQRRLAAFREDTAALRLLLGRYERHVDSLPRAINVFEVVEHPFRALLASSRAVGSINYAPDPVDGTARSVQLLYQFRDSTFVAFPLAAALAADSARFLGCGRPPVWRGRSLALCDVIVPLERGTMLINWKGPYRDPASRRETYRIIPVAQVLHSFEQVRGGQVPEVPLETFRGKVVFVGASGAGLFDTRANPFGPADPGVLIHATVADNLLNHDFLRRAPAALSAAAIVVTALLAAAAVVMLTAASAAALAGLALAAAYVAFTFWLFAMQALWLDAAAPTLGVLLTFTGGMVVNYFTEGRQKKQIRDMFSKYVAPEYVAQLAEDPSKLHLEGRRAELSILFSDIRGFTSISERMQPTEVVEFLNEYLSEMAAIVKRSGGTLDKFIGDAVMAFWGEPVPLADHAERACDCALAMRDKMLEIGERFVREGKPPIRIGIGINTAEVVVGNIGSLEHKLDYTVIGDGVNLASRLEGQNKDFGTTIIVSEFTLARLAGRYDARPLGEVKVKGKEKAVGIFELLGRKAA
jgi:adenylate cyclase